MSLTEGNGGNEMVMPVAPMYGGGGSGFGGWGGDNGWWIILLFLFALGGWGNGFGGGYGGGAMPYIMSNTTNADVQRGFDQQSVMFGINGLQSGISGLSTQLCNSTADIQQSLCNGFAGVNATVSSGFANAETAANARQMANMNQAFGAQTAMMQGFNSLGSQFADCCCENRLATANLNTAIAQAANSIIQNQNAGVQAIKDQLCAGIVDDVRNIIEEGGRRSQRRLSGEDDIVVFLESGERFEEAVEFFFGYFRSGCVENVFFFAGDFDIDAAGTGDFDAAIMNMRIG